MAKKGSSIPAVKIAIAAVLGLLIIEAYRYQQTKGTKQANAEIAKLVDAFPKKLAPAQTQAQRERESERGWKLENAPLESDERCVDGQRFRHVADGWIQNGSC